MTATTRPTPTASAILARTPKSTNHSDSRSPRVAPEKAPDKTPTKVMPICTVDRHRPGSVARARARRETNDVAIDQRLQSGAPGGDDGELRQRKEAIHQD